MTLADENKIGVELAWLPVKRRSRRDGARRRECGGLIEVQYREKRESEGEWVTTIQF